MDGTVDALLDGGVELFVGVDCDWVVKEAAAALIGGRLGQGKSEKKKENDESAKRKRRGNDLHDKRCIVIVKSE